MKVNLQKMIVLITVIAVIISILNISAFATSEPTAMTSYEFHAAQAYLIEKYVNGDITYSEWNERQVAVLDEYLETNKSLGDSAYASAISIGSRFQGITQKINSAVSQWGDGARERVSDWWNSICNSNNVPTETTQTSTTDLMGAGALAKRYKDGVVIEIDACDYIVVNANGDRFTWRTNDGRPFTSYHYNANGSLSYINTAYENYSCYFYLSDGTYYKIYGDVRYEDGTQAPTDDEWEYGSIKKFDKMPEKDLEDLLNDFSEEMERQNPDLSSIEGLLRAIYARIGSLDSDNDNQLLSEILTAIKVIKSTDTDNTELLELLEDIKNALVFGDDENKDTFSEQLKKIIDNQITRDDFVIDKDLFNNRGEILKERLLGKFSFLYNTKTFVIYCFDEYSNTSENPEINFEFNNKSYSINLNSFNEHLPTIQWILAAFFYLTYAYHTYRKIPSYINGGDNE